MQAKQLFEAGRLEGAIQSLQAGLRTHPLVEGNRSFLVELLCFAGQWERADQQLEVLSRQQPEAIYGVHLFRQLLRAAQAREQFFTEGRVPEFFESPTEALQRYLQAWVSLRDGAVQEAAELLDQAESDRPHLRGTCNGQAFDDLRDLDDLTASVLEILTMRGLYYWLPLSRVQSLVFEAQSCPRDLLWRPVRMTLQGEVDASDVFIPVIYGGASGQSEAARLGRETDWLGGEQGPMRGIGQRLFLVGEDSLPVMELHELVVEGEEAGHG